MKTLLLSTVVLAAVPRIARGDGFFKCDSNMDGQAGCADCDSDGNPDNGIQCSTSGTDPVAVGACLGVVGFVAWRIGKKRRNR